MEELEQLMQRLCGLVVTIFLLLCEGESFAQSKFLMSYSSFSSNQIFLWVAKGQGLFKCYGTDPDLIFI
jgi:hypothetical protein